MGRTAFEITVATHERRFCARNSPIRSYITNPISHACSQDLSVYDFPTSRANLFKIATPVSLESTYPLYYYTLLPSPSFIRSPSPTIIISPPSLSQPDHNILLVQIPFVPSINLNTMMAQNLLDPSALDTHPRFAHHLCPFPDPDDEYEFHPLGFCIVCVFDSGVGVLGLGRVEFRGEFRETAYGDGGRRFSVCRAEPAR